MSLCAISRHRVPGISRPSAASSAISVISASRFAALNAAMLFFATLNVEKAEAIQRKGQ
jgi:hypothetical protein